LIKSQIFVIRDGKKSLVDSASLVPGDIIFVRSGDKVPADSILGNASDMRVDGSNLTGETEPIVRKPKLEGDDDGTAAIDSPHVLFSSDVIVSGEGYAIVVHTGKHSILGRLSNLNKRIKPKKSTLSQEIRRFCKNISTLALLTSFIFFFVALARGRNFTYAATFGIGIVIAWVPQGLPLTVTMILAISGRRVAEKNVLVKDLHGLETLGSITLLATDKTGTLTSNEMKVVDIWLNATMWYSGDQNPAPPDTKPLKLDVSGVAQLMHVCVTCSKARYDRMDVSMDKRSIIGDATETGLLKFASKRLNNIDRVHALISSQTCIQKYLKYRFLQKQKCT
jgi:sodium/potassium-transporting ATPase subunit alpha